MTIHHARVRFSVIGLSLLAVAVGAEAANENGGFTRTPLAIGAVANKLRLAGDDKGVTGKPLEIQVGNKLEPVPNLEMHAYIAEFSAGGHSDWHSHPGLEIVINSADSTKSLTFYILNRDGTSCRRHELQPGQSLLVLPTETHAAINESGGPASIIVERLHPGIGSAPAVTRHENQPPVGTCPLI